MNEETLIQFGGAVKAVGNGRIEGYLVQYSDADNPDKSVFRDVFTPKSDLDFEDGQKVSVFFNHGLSEDFGVRRLGRVEGKHTPKGLWIEGALNLNDPKEQQIYDMALKNELGWSSGAPAHLVRRSAIEGKNAHHVDFWPVSEASLTKTPADERNVAIASIKSLQTGAKTLKEMVAESNGVQIDTAADSVAVKGALLGDVETSMLMAALERLNAAMMNYLYRTVYGDSYGGAYYGDVALMGAADDDDKPLDQDALRACFDEYRDTAMAAVAALAPGTKSADGAMKTIEAVFAPHGASDVLALLTRLPMKSYLEAMGSVVSDCDRRVSWYEAERSIKAGRAISNSNLATLRDIHDGMNTLKTKLKEMLDRHSAEGKSAEGALENASMDALFLDALYTDVLLSARIS